MTSPLDGGYFGCCNQRMHAQKQYFVYILASRRNGTLYIGVTSNLIRRIWEHRNGLADGFTKQHTVHRLVWFEIHATAEAAIHREKRLKTWLRAWKLRLIEESNPECRDLYEEIASP